MSRKSKARKDSWDAAPTGGFVGITHVMLKEPAWRDLSYGARCLYLQVKSYFNGRNNWLIYLGVRRAAEELGASRSSAELWFRELQDHGFLRVATAAALGVEGAATATMWRLTELGHMGERPTCEFQKWTPDAGLVSRKSVQSKNKTPHRKSGQTVPKIGAQRTENRDTCTENRDGNDTFDADPCPENRCISTSPYSGRSGGASDAA